MDLENLRSVAPVKDIEVHRIPFLNTDEGATVSLVVAKYEDKYYVSQHSIAEILGYTPQNVWHHLKKYAAILVQCLPTILADGKTWMIPYREVGKLLECFTAPTNTSGNESKKDESIQKRRKAGKEYLIANLENTVETAFSAVVAPAVQETASDVKPVEEVLGNTEVDPVDEVAATKVEDTDKAPVLSPMEKLQKAVLFDLVVVDCLKEVHQKLDDLSDSDMKIVKMVSDISDRFLETTQKMTETIEALNTRNEENIKNFQLSLAYEKFTPTDVPKGEIGPDQYPLNYNISYTDMGKQLKLFSKTGNVHPDVARYLLLINNTIKSGARDDDQGKPFVFKRRIINRWKDESTLTGFKFEEGYELIFSQHGAPLVKEQLLNMIKVPGMVDYEYDPVTDKFKSITLNFRKYAAYMNYKGSAKIDDCHMSPTKCERLITAIKAIHKKNAKIAAPAADNTASVQ